MNASNLRLFLIFFLMEKLTWYFLLIICQAVTKAKLGYDPLEVNPEDMVRFAKEKPQVHGI